MFKRSTLYKDPEARVFTHKDGLFTAKMAKELLAWKEPKDKDEKLEGYMVLDREGKTIRCDNIGLQRQFYKQVASDLMYDILAGNWEFNFETIIIGKSGLVLDGKHRLVALVLAVQEWKLNPDKYTFWDSEPKLEILIGLGAKETKRLVNTIGTGKPRTLADSLFASGIFTENMRPVQIKRLTKLTEFAVRMLWLRTGAKADAYSPRASHSDALDFIERHPTMLRCIKTVNEENCNKRNKLFSLLPGGGCSGLLYLMSVSKSNSELYNKSSHPDESILNFKAEEEAESYWLRLANKDKCIKPIISKIAKLESEGNQNPQERIAILIKGWNQFQKTGTVTTASIRIKTKIDSHGYRRLMEDPIVGGIDLGRHQ